MSSADVNLIVGKEIARRRRALRLSLAQLGEQCGVSLQQVHKYETGQSNLSVSMLVKLARCLAARPSELVAPLDDAP
ncbi:MAG: helix-turn-helix transcriptional regulator [Phenylobacterium sp.]|uniref:helix-turn-helix domain-containing protein n=1 Tax=Phenylobacterium sp. TaxID=1871053 RepID=UPI001A4B2337|nr:helix-turn-helix transcriptional regulator [Phenylobacterium sp.]MBL8773779.1 helix-turn-helix transcriptional regulator [Phenylobacterium sp.]